VLDEVKWTKQDNTIITSGQDGYTIVKGYLVDGNSQTTTLRVDQSQNNVDTTYNCLITSHEHNTTDKSTVVTLNVLSKSVLCVKFTLVLTLANWLVRLVPGHKS
jgi:uncharacterized membrane protein